MHNELSIHFCHTNRCEVCVGRAHELLRGLLPAGRVVTIADANVAHLCGPLGLDEVVTIEASEQNKSIDTANMLWHRLIELGADRDTFLLGVGGGITTDLVGFVASTFMRGVHFGLIPTTLLAQVDAAIGGKCGVNFDGYKNMVGAFALADFVVCDVELLSSLPPREVRSGMAEVIKSGIIGDAALFELCERNDLRSLLEDRSVFDEVVRRAAAVKCGIVGRDLLEGGERRFLNLGHTLAHAIESLTREFTHGEAVAIGLVYAAAKSLRAGLLLQADYERIVSVVERYDLPTHTNLPEESLREAMAHDKKAHCDTIRWVLPTAIGKGMREVVEPK